MPWIKFLVDHTIKDDSGTSFKAGDVVERSEDSCEHFTRRFLAEACDPPEPEKPKAKAKPKPEPKAEEKPEDDKTDGESN